MESLSTRIIKLYKTKHKFLKFLIAGAPSFLIAIPLNIYFVEYFGLHKSLAYFYILCLQISLNFLMLRMFVFRSHKGTKMLTSFIKFFSGIAAFRFIDWLLYSILVWFIPKVYILIQVSNVLLFSIIKYRFSRSVIEK